MTDLPSPSDYDRGYERCIVSFIDILGYRALLNTRHANDIRRVVEALRNFTAGDGNDNLPLTRMDEARLYTEAFSESVSDAVVRVRTVDTQSEDGPVVAELIDLMHAVVECVNQGIFIRGGMTIGPVHIGLDGKGPIFGTGMVRAFEIESKEAIYPRIMIDEEAIATYLSDESLWQDGAYDSHEAKLALSFIRMEADGSYFLDYLRAADVGEFDDGEIGRFRFLGRHRQMILGNLVTSDRKVRRKMVWLANYHNTFMAELRATYDMSDASGAFHAEIGVAPEVLFDSLMIDPSWAGPLSRLADIGVS